MWFYFWYYSINYWHPLVRWSVTKLFFPNPKRVVFLQKANFKCTNSTTPLAKRSGLVCANSKHRILGHKISLRVKERMLPARQITPTKTVQINTQLRGCVSSDARPQKIIILEVRGFKSRLRQKIWLNFFSLKTFSHFFS